MAEDKPPALWAKNFADKQHSRILQRMHRPGFISTAANFPRACRNNRTRVFARVPFAGVMAAFLLVLWAPSTNGQIPSVSLTLIPPSPVTEQITLELRGAVRNVSTNRCEAEFSFYLDKVAPENLLGRQKIEVSAETSGGTTIRVPAKGHAGDHRVVLTVRANSKVQRVEQPIKILAGSTRSTGRLGGAWVDIYHHDPAEGKPFNTDLGQLTGPQWRELVRAMHAAEQNIVVVTMMFDNFTHRGRHKIETEGYRGRAYYPSKLFPGRMPITTSDPLEVIMSEADRLGMHVMPGVGCYAFFDYSPGSLRWHKQVAQELWERYGHHRSFYGWYVSDEKDGGLGSAEERREIVAFFREFTPFARSLAADKPVMLAINSYHFRGAEETYRELLPHLDIICPFGFHRMPSDDLSGEEAATLMQSWCDAAGTHLWMDVESFVFRNGVELHPRPIEGLISDFRRFPNFEKILHYQFPGLMSSPEMSRKPGGEPSVKLYLDYKKWLEGKELGTEKH